MPIGSALLSSPLLARRDWHYRACLAITGFYQQMDVRLLEAFRAVVDHRSVTQAAAAMRVTQPTVSLQIARLEQELGFPLFDRSNGRLKPTAEGMPFYAEADKVLTGMDRVSEAARQIRTAQGRLIIASHPSAAISVLPVLISAFVAERPGVHVRLLSRNSDVIGRLLPSESYDVGIAELPVDDAVVRLTRFRVRCVAILSSTHPLACCPTLSPATLSGQPAVALARTLQTSARVALAEWSPVVEAEYFASVCGLVASGAGWSVVDRCRQRPFSTWASSPARSSLPSTTRLAPFVRATGSRRSWRNPSCTCWPKNLARSTPEERLCHR
jgi:DNA-binding transcriptional LysR family regulator